MTASTPTLRILGIDPGSVSGAYGLLTPTSVTAGDLPTANRQIDPAEWARILADLNPHVAIIERVASRPHQGVGSTFNFGMGCGLIRGVISAMGIPLHEVSAAKWKAHFGLDTDKEKSRALCARLYPGLD